MGAETRLPLPSRYILHFLCPPPHPPPATGFQRRILRSSAILHDISMLIAITSAKRFYMLHVSLNCLGKMQCRQCIHDTSASDDDEVVGAASCRCATINSFAKPKHIGHGSYVSARRSDHDFFHKNYYKECCVDPFTILLLYLVLMVAHMA